MYSWKSHYVVQADYQHWANEVLFTSLDYLQPDLIGSDQGLFFNSIHHTVDHILMVSQSWLARLQGDNLAVNYKIINNPDWRELKIALRRETRKLQSWLNDQSPEFFDTQIEFTGGDGKPRNMWVRDALTHLFTHYAHHRGQISAVATRLGAPCPEMDFVYYKREMERLLSETGRHQTPPAGG
ncbi:MAG: DinB family protein [Pseudomonadota bacterium]